MLNIAVCDDEDTALEELCGSISGCLDRMSSDCSVTRFRSGEELLESLRTDSFDAVFLDIEMGGINGLDTARKMRENSYGGSIIFVTVLGELVYDSFDAAPYDYLVKPVSDARLEKTLGRLLRSANIGGELVLNPGRETRIVPRDEIIYCEVFDKTVFLHLSDGGTVSFRGSLEKLEKELDGRFFKCHRSFLVNLGMIEGFGKTVKMRGGSEVPLSKLRKKDLIRAEADYLKYYGR